MVERTLFPEAIGRLLAETDLELRSVYAELADRCIAPVAARHRIDAVAAGVEDAAWLEVPPAAALIRVRRHAFAATGEPIEWSDDRYRGDRVDFAIDNTAAAPVLARRFAGGGE